MQGPVVSQVPFALSEGRGQFIDCSTQCPQNGKTGDTIAQMPFSLILSLLPAMFGFAAANQSEEVRTLVVDPVVYGPPFVVDHRIS